MSKNQKKNLITFSVILSIFFIFIDQITKFFAQKYLEKDFSIIADFFKFQYSQNRGIAFGINIPMPILIVLTIVLLSLFIYFSKKEFKIHNKTTLFSLSLIISGGISNLIDRFIHGYVIDFISIWRWPNFNLADVFITLGILIIIIFYGKIKR